MVGCEKGDVTLWNVGSNTSLHVCKHTQSVVYVTAISFKGNWWSSTVHENSNYIYIFWKFWFVYIVHNILFTNRVTFIEIIAIIFGLVGQKVIWTVVVRAIIGWNVFICILYSRYRLYCESRIWFFSSYSHVLLRRIGDIWNYYSSKVFS